MNQIWMLKKCVKSLFDVEPSLQKKVVICDDASPLYDEMAKAMNELPVKVIRYREKQTYAHLINAGLKIAHQVGADRLITINNDIEHITPFIDICEGEIKRDPEIEVIGCLLFYPDGRTQHGGVEVTDEGGLWCQDHYRGKIGEWGKRRYVHHTTGAWTYIKIPRRTDRQIDLLASQFYDEKFPFSFEDVDFNLRLWEQGKRTFFTPDVFHIHHESVTRTRRVTKEILDSARIFKESNYDMKLINEQIAEANHHMVSS